MVMMMLSINLCDTAMFYIYKNNYIFCLLVCLLHLLGVVLLTALLSNYNVLNSSYYLIVVSYPT